MIERFRSSMLDAGGDPATAEVGRDAVQHAYMDIDVTFSRDEIPHAADVGSQGLEDVEELAGVAAVALVVYLGYRIMEKGLHDAKRKHGAVI